MLRLLALIALTTLLSACGRTVPFKDQRIASEQQHSSDYNDCIQQAMPLYPTRWVPQPYWVQVPVYGRRVIDGRETWYLSHYQSRLQLSSVDANEAERQAYIERCMSAKGYTYRYLSREELDAAGLD